MTQNIRNIILRLYFRVQHVCGLVFSFFSPLLGCGRIATEGAHISVLTLAAPNPTKRNAHTETRAASLGDPLGLATKKSMLPAIFFFLFFFFTSEDVPHL